MSCVSVQYVCVFGNKMFLVLLMLNLFLTANSYFDNGGALFNFQYVVLLIDNL